MHHSEIQILSFSCSFRQRIFKETLTRDLAPPEENPGSATDWGGEGGSDTQWRTWILYNTISTVLNFTVQ